MAGTRGYRGGGQRDQPREELRLIRLKIENREGRIRALQQEIAMLKRREMVLEDVLAKTPKVSP